MRQTSEGLRWGRSPKALRASLLAWSVIFILILVSGCSIFHLPGRAIRSVTGKGAGYDPVVLQQRIMRFTDDYSGALLVAMDRLSMPTNSEGAITHLHLKLNCLNSTYAIATGPNELMNLADMFVLVTLTREIVQEYWIPGPYGQSARPMLKACQDGESNITAIALSVVTPEQLNEVRAAMAQWHREHTDVRSALFARGLGLEIEMIARRQEKQSSPGSLFSLFRLDPLAGLDPAARELAQTRLFGERTLFLAQRKPTLVRWQGELFVLEAAAMPPLLEVRTNTTQVAQALARASKTVEQFPALVRSEREAILNALPSQEPTLTNLATQVTAILEAAREMSDSLNATLKTASGIQQTAAAESARKGTAPHPPGIEDYTESAKQVALAAEQMTELLRTLNQTLEPTNVARLSAQVTPVIRQAQDSSRAVGDYVFRRAILLVSFSCLAVLVTALVFQWIRRLIRRSGEGGDSS